MLINDKLIELVIKSVENPKLLNEFDTSYESAIRFNYDNVRYRVSCELFVETVQGKFLMGGNDARQMEKLLKENIKRVL